MHILYIYTHIYIYLPYVHGIYIYTLYIYCVKCLLWLNEFYKSDRNLNDYKCYKMKLYTVVITDIKQEFSYNKEINHLDKKVRLEIPKPDYRNLQYEYGHINNIEIFDHDSKNELPLHELPLHDILDIND